MDRQHSLRGGCSCGRNHYIVTIPSNTSETPRVFFDNSISHRRSQATPLSAWLRVPLSWYQSSTQAFMEDETHANIRRSYTSPQEQSCKRQFCGFCGTPLTYWSEEPASEAQYISLTLGSLAGRDLRDLEELGLIPSDSEDDEKEVAEAAVTGRTGHGRDTSEGLPWFETIIEGSRLGKMKKSWGKQHSADGRWKIEWEITEWADDGTSNEGESGGPGKRKVGVLDEDEGMDGTH